MFNALNLMENESFLEKLKFGIGDGNFNYYLYNWKCHVAKNIQTILNVFDYLVRLARKGIRKDQIFFVFFTNCIWSTLFYS